MVPFLVSLERENFKKIKYFRFLFKWNNFNFLFDKNWFACEKNEKSSCERERERERDKR